MKKRLLILCFSVAALAAATGQRVQWNAFRLTEENDFFNLTQRGIDRYYTQGMRYEFMYRVSKKRVLEKIMLPLKGASINQYSTSISQLIYTPANTSNLNFIGDMPYAGTLFLSQRLESADTLNQLRLTSRLDAGLIGPAALAKGAQDVFHNIIHNDIAVGWDTQLPNDILLNYSARIEKNLISPKDWIRLELRGEANLGTLLVNAVAGFNLEAGNWYSNRNFRWQIFFRPEVRGVIYNALLQGGALNRGRAEEDPDHSKYYHRKVEPFVYSHATGFRVQYKKFGLFYRQVNLSSEFTRQPKHYYGTLMFTFLLGKYQQPAKF